jgi:hypothetical protein
MNPDGDNRGSSEPGGIPPKELTKRAVLHLLAMPFYLGAVGGIAYLGWKLSMKFVTEPDLRMRILVGAAILLLVVADAVLAFYILRFVHWATPSKPAVPNDRDQKDRFRC